MNRDALLKRLDEIRWLRYRLSILLRNVEDGIRYHTEHSPYFSKITITPEIVIKLKKARKDIHKVNTWTKRERKFILSLLSNWK